MYIVNSDGSHPSIQSDHPMLEVPENTQYRPFPVGDSRQGLLGAFPQEQIFSEHISEVHLSFIFLILKPLWSLNMHIFRTLKWQKMTMTHSATMSAHNKMPIVHWQKGTE